MMRCVPVLAAASVLLGAPSAFAQEALHESDGRYVYRFADDGTLRLDTRTGQVSVCARHDSGWSCNAMPDERAAYEREITRLADENAKLRKSLAEVGAQPPRNGEPKTTDPKNTDPKNTESKHNELRLRLPSQEDIDRMMSVVEKFWRRMIDMISKSQDELEKT